MNAARYLTLTIVIVALGMGRHAHPYEIGTHRDLTQAAAERSVLQLDPTVLRNLGLDKGINDSAQPFPNSRNEPRTVQQLLQDGAEFEDNVSLVPLEVRVRFHFYNPVTGEGLSRPPFISQTSAPERAQLTGSVGEYFVTRRGADGISRLFLIYFTRDTDGVWRLDTM